MPSVARCLVLPLRGELPASLLAVLRDYRLLVNEVIREALLSGKTARGSLSRFARDRAFLYQFTGQHAVVAAEIGVSLANPQRRRLRNGLLTRVPYVRRPFLRTNPRTFHFDLASGKVRLSLRKGEWCSFVVEVAPYHRGILGAANVRVKQLHVTPDRVVLFLEKDVREPFAPTSLLALDTNESSLDGVEVSPARAHTVQVTFPELRSIQLRSFNRRRYLQRKKSHDRRVARTLLASSGRREYHRIVSRLHDLSRGLVDVAALHQAAIALEDLTHLPRPRPRIWRRADHGCDAPPRLSAKDFRPGPGGSSIARLSTRRQNVASQSTGSTRSERQRPARDVGSTTVPEAGWARCSSA